MIGEDVVSCKYHVSIPSIWGGELFWQDLDRRKFANERGKIKRRSPAEGATTLSSSLDTSAAEILPHRGFSGFGT